VRERIRETGLFIERGKEIDVIYRDDEWSRALIALAGISRNVDVRPMATLLKRGEPVPGDVAEELGMLLDPPWGDRGPRLVLNIPPRWDKGKAIRELGKKRALRERMLRDYSKNKSKKYTIGEFAHETGKSEAYLRKCWELTDKEVVRQSQLIIHEGVGAGTTRKR
jgi:hypothetical protein